jgi:hypothetical protein
MGDGNIQKRFCKNMAVKNARRKKQGFLAPSPQKKTF